MSEIKDLDSLNRSCELDPRYQNLMEAFRQAVRQEELGQVQVYLLGLLVSRKMLAEEQALFDRYNLSEGKLSVLLLLKNAAQNQLTPSEIAEATQVTRGTMTGLLAGLERDGYVARQEDPADRRRAIIELTDRSLAVIDRLLVERFRHIEKLFSCFSPAELEQQRLFIEKVNSRLAGDSSC